MRARAVSQVSHFSYQAPPAFFFRFSRLQMCPIFLTVNRLTVLLRNT